MNVFVRTSSFKKSPKKNLAMKNSWKTRRHTNPGNTELITAWHELVHDFAIVSDILVSSPNKAYSRIASRVLVNTTIIRTLLKRRSVVIFVRHNNFHGNFGWQRRLSLIFGDDFDRIRIFFLPIQYLLGDEISVVPKRERGVIVTSTDNRVDYLSVFSRV